MQQIDVVFLGDSILRRWSGESFSDLCEQFSGACANLAIPGEVLKK